MARYLLSNDVFVRALTDGVQTLDQLTLGEVAVSEVTFAYVASQIEASHLKPIERSRFRTNLARFRDLLTDAGGDVPGLTNRAIEYWTDVMIAELVDEGNGVRQEMSTEDRLVVAIALAEGYVYVTNPADWNDTLENELRVSLRLP